VVRWTGWGHGRLRGRGTAWRVEYFGHLVVIGAVEVLAEGGVGVFVLKGLLVRPLLSASLLATLASSLRSRGSEGVVVEVPSWRGEVEPRGFCKLVCRAGLIGGSQVGSCTLPCLTSASFMPLRGWRLWYSFISWGACRLVRGSQVLSLSG